MYTPIQLPYLLDDVFARHVEYTETLIDGYSDSIICVWEMMPCSGEELSLTNIIVMDGCIDLVVDFGHQLIGFAGMKKTDFDFTIKLPNRFLGLRLMPGIFHQLTNRPASEAMDNFLPLEDIFADFNIPHFFSLNNEEAKKFIIDFIKSKIDDIPKNHYTALFPMLMNDFSDDINKIYDFFPSMSLRQRQRLFQRHYGLSPKQILSIIRFQYCLKTLISPQSSPSDILDICYYDQSHFLNDFKKNIGITPFELVKKYKK